MRKQTPTISREFLAVRLEGEFHFAAAVLIRAGADPRSILSELRPFVKQRNDEASERSIVLFQDVCAGRIKVGK